ncbi:MAG: SNF2-related protein, partial [Verrucomicrobiota bacterium]
VAPGLPSRLVPLLKSGLTLEPAEFVRDWPSLSQHFETADLAIISEQPEVMLTLEGSLNHLEAKLSFRYGESLEAATTERESVFERGDELVLVDVEFERAAEEQLLGAGFARRGEAGKFVLKQKEAILQFLAFGYPEFQRTWNLETGERFAHALEQVEPIEPVLQFTGSGEDWFAMELEFESAANSSISREEVRRMLQSGQTSRPVGGGRVAVLSPERVAAIDEAISDCEPAQHSPGTYEIGQHQTGYLAALSEDLGLQTSGAVPWQRAVQGIEFYPLSETLDSLLRPYQSIGVEWMQDLASRGMGGVLADDMGLGKTIQTLSFLYSIGGSSLVVCPSSLVSNWVAEAEKFIPEVSVVALEGPDRKSVYESNPDAGIYVTSYALLRRDLDRYRNREFDALILDEAQQIKNPDSQIAKAAHSLRGSFRFALTGTPVENSVRDLWSITQFALPGYLGDRKRFAERFEKPLSAKQVPDGLRERLSRRLRPIILRRLKSEVARDLPEKIEQVVTCDLLPKQRAIYDTILRESRERILDAEGAPKRMLALTALLRLRQACCDLRLLGLQDLEPEAASIKSGVLAEVLESAIEGEHRVLVFSQFVEMLQLLVPQLAERGVDFCYLDGSTKNRAEVVQRFQEGKAPVFLISLKAGGVGLNLTAADTVIHVDPWWNPAVEAQATDRAHRIGQTRVVTAYKLITRGTVEEKILALQERKRELTESLLSASGDAGLSEEELLGLFS